MSDFSAYKGWAIPEGKVKQVTDEAGNVLWSARKPVTITLTGASSNSYAEYNGTQYTVPSTFEANIGDTINFYCGQVPSSATIYLNNNQVANAAGSTNYSYTVACDLNVSLQKSGSGTSVQMRMYITEIPEGQIMFTINGENYFAEKGMTWAEWFASDYNTTGETEGDIKDANGNEVSMDAVIVGGTAYEVGFAPPAATVTLVCHQSTDDYGQARATINGITYQPLYADGDNKVAVLKGQNVQLSLEIGTKIELYVSGNSTGASRNKIYLNGTSVGSDGGSNSYVSTQVYTYTVTGNATITMQSYYMKSVGPSMYATYGIIDITEE